MDWIEWSLLAIFVIALVVEAVALARHDRPITGAARTDGRMWLIWPWGLGVLSGHFWSPWQSICYGWIVLIGIGSGVITHDAITRWCGRKNPAWVPFVALLFGLACGTVLWSSGY